MDLLKPELQEAIPDTAGGNHRSVHRDLSVLSWLGLICILVLYASFVAHLHPTNYFGLSGDDALYLSSAKALVEGKGYVLLSLPGTPSAAKHPILYPLLLSWVWRWNPSFPANLSLAAALTSAFGAVYLVMAYLFLKTLKGISFKAALIITAFCAVHPQVLLYSANLLSDIPFAATALAATVLATEATKKDSGPTTTILCGIVTGLALLLRVLGVPIAIGLYIAIFLRRGWHKSAVFATFVAPFLVALFWHFIFSAPARSSFAASNCVRSWQTSWSYYTSYFAFWKIGAIDSHMLWQYSITNLEFLFYQLGAYFLDPRHLSLTPLTMILFVLVCLMTAWGLIRQIQRGSWQPAHLALALYILPVLIWDYPSPERFLLPFLPLIAAAAWLESKHLAGQISASAHKERGVQQRVAVTLCFTTSIAILLAASISWRRGITTVANVSERRAALLPEKRQAYDWLREKTAADARIVAYEDASAFLYSARQSISPTIFSPAGKGRSDVLDSQLVCLLSTAQPTGASYWMVSDDDFGPREWPDAAARARSKEQDLEKSQALLFRSTGGHVRIYKVVVAAPPDSEF